MNDWQNASSCAGENRVRIISHTQKHDPCAPWVAFLQTLCDSVQSVKILHLSPSFSFLVCSGGKAVSEPVFKAFAFA